MKSRWFNFRPLCVFFVFLLLGSLFAFYISKTLAITIIVSLIFVGLILFTAITRKKIIYAILPIIAFCLGLGLYNLSVHNFNKTTLETPSIIEARIYNMKRAEDNSLAVSADSVKFDNKKVNTNLSIYIYDNSELFENLQIGSVIKFTPTNLYKSDLFYNEIPNSTRYSENLKYTAIANIENLTYLKTDKTFAETIKSYIKNNLGKGLTNENVEIAYSALFGEKEMLPEGQYNAFQLSGVAHILAVSGLHVSIIVAILYKLLDLLKIKRWWKVVLVFIAILFYAYVCNFSYSVIRAGIMSLLMLIAPLVYREYDSLAALSFAGIVIYLINPLCVFDISFLMSFACSIGIIMLYKPIKSALNHTKMPAWLVNSLALSLSVEISLLFIMAFFFKRFNLIAIVSNIVIIPLFTIAFAVIFVCAMLSLIMPFIAHALVIINPLLNLISVIAIMFANTPISNFSTIHMNYISIMLYFVVIFLLGRICIAKKEYKCALCLPIVAILIMIMI